MAEGDQKPNVNIDAGLSAKFEAKTEIPKESSGRLLDALTDIIRPFSESRGLRADQIRLQREDILIEIAQRASRRIEIEGKSPKPVSSKFLVPFLEKASCEESSSSLIDWWAGLLVQQSLEPNNLNVMLLDILSKMGSAEAKALKRLCDKFYEGRIKYLEPVNSINLYQSCRLDQEAAYSLFNDWTYEFIDSFEVDLAKQAEHSKLSGSVAWSLPLISDEDKPWVVLECHVHGRNTKLIPEERSKDLGIWDSLRLLELVKVDESERAAQWESIDGKCSAKYLMRAFIPTTLGFYLFKTCEEKYY